MFSSVVIKHNMHCAFVFHSVMAPFFSFLLLPRQRRLKQRLRVLLTYLLRQIKSLICKSGAVMEKAAAAEQSSVGGASGAKRAGKITGEGGYG